MSLEVRGNSQPEIGLPNEVRREQTERELARVEIAVKAWFNLRNAHDNTDLSKYAGLHKTRLDALESVLQYGLKTLNAELRKVDVTAGRDRQEVYAECRDFDRALVWIQRVWAYYKEKLDQRDDASLAPLLQAAEEVIWSCYAQVFLNKKNVPTGVIQGPAPLAYVDAEYSPATWEARKPSPSQLRRASDIQGLEAFVMTLPVPVLRLPPWCANSPWWLVFVAHEVGHNIQRELNLVDRFGKLLEKVCLDNGRPQKPDAEKWKGWGSEIFADLFSVMMMGQSAVRSVREIEYGPEREMNAPQSGYPSPVVRLALVASAADRLNLDGSTALGGLQLDKLSRDNPLTQADLKMVTPVLNTALGCLSDTISTLEELCGLQESRSDLVKKVKYWGQNLLKNPPDPTRSLQAPRFIVCGALVAWDKATRISKSAERQTAMNVLSTNTIDVLRKSGPEGTRAKLPGRADLDRYGAALAQQVLHASRQTRLLDAELEDFEG